MNKRGDFMKKQKIYERTGIKKEKRKNQQEILTATIHEQETQKILEKGNKRKKQTLYNLGLMSHQKECAKVKKLLEEYATNIKSYNANTEQIIIGYKEYFEIYGNNMTPYALRAFKKAILNTVATAEKVLPAASNFSDESEETNEENSLEEAIFDFCIANYDEVIESNIDLGTITKLILFLSNKGIPAADTIKNLDSIKVKVKSIYTELRK